MDASNQDVLLASLLKLLNGDKERCFQLVEAVRNQYPGKSMQWCLEKAIYDLRWGKKQVKPNPKLSRWGEGGGNFPATSKPPTQVVPSHPQPAKTNFQPSLPPPPPPNPALSKPSVEVPSSVALPNLKALVQTKQQTKVSKPASYATKERLRKLAGNQDVAERLVANLKSKNPYQSEQWIYEKAIFDLERDRH